ncbi:hypothetical protein [Aeromicrobium sp. Root472D3]|uniref:hypothetical protein n=1 Tax=Aeromicrobium sp. Root472D3 TaxID=1736540 RepID=UPI0006F8EEDC|nr:hypothetical protein [Aeromicrobium sp. Root472D3]KQX75080.1 hypothetical protein ASD10_07740 [Aeromicrobium sp. Root472D3]
MTPPPTGPHRFDFAWDERYRRAARLVGVTPAKAWIEVDDTSLTVRFGWWRLTSPIDNVVDAEVTGPYGFAKTAGPPHLSLADRGITFATNGRAGLCVSFREPVPGIDPTKIIRHPGATITAADPEGLARALGRPIR